jgi:hypothetical protein
MKIREIQQEIEESLANLPAVILPSELTGLRHFPLGDYNPQVSIRYLKNINNGRKVREDASAAYFDPHNCELVIRFVPLEPVSQEEGLGEQEELQEKSAAIHQELTRGDFGRERPLSQLVAELKKAEEDMPFVGLKWFRDQFLPRCGLDWALDPRKRGVLLRRATEERLVLTYQVPNPDNALYPVTAIRVNRAHPRLQNSVPTRVAGFKPVAIQGKPISDTVIEDRR